MSCISMQPYLYTHPPSPPLHLFRPPILLPPSAPLFRRGPGQGLVDMWREPVAQLACVCRQVQRHLLQLLHHQPPGALVAAELSVQEQLPLSDAAYNGPHQQVRHVDRYRLRQAGEFGCVRADRGTVAAGFQRKNLQTADFLYTLMLVTFS